MTCLTTTPLRMLSLLGSIIAIGGFSIAVLLVILRLTLDVYKRQVLDTGISLVTQGE